MKSWVELLLHHTHKNSQQVSFGHSLPVSVDVTDLFFVLLFWISLPKAQLRFTALQHKHLKRPTQKRHVFIKLKRWIKTKLKTQRYNLFVESISANIIFILPFVFLRWIMYLGWVHLNFKKAITFLSVSLLTQYYWD